MGVSGTGMTALGAWLGLGPPLRAFLRCRGLACMAITTSSSSFAGGTVGRKNVAETLRSFARDRRLFALLLEEFLPGKATPAPPPAAPPCPELPEPNCKRLRSERRDGKPEGRAPFVDVDAVGCGGDSPTDMCLPDPPRLSCGEDKELGRELLTGLGAMTGMCEGDGESEDRRGALALREGLGSAMAR